MAFNSLTFAPFFLLSFVIYWSFRSHRSRLRFLLVASLIFYMSWSPAYVLLLVAVIAVNYFASHRIVADPSRKRLFLGLAVCTNLGILAIFKYAGFFGDNVAALAGALDLPHWQSGRFSFVLPLGISFYTFQSMSYTIDVFRGVTPPCRSLLVFSNYVTFFPQLVAGPIVRAEQLIHQMASRRSITRDAIFRGINRICIGLIKKVLVADWIAGIVEPVFAAPMDYSSLANLTAVYLYAFQILFDFAGYCDIAIGCAMLLGFQLPINFDRPYLSTSVTEFWRRWHITLSNWLRDYLYIPMGGNRYGIGKTYRNLIVTMLLGGLWHGASWNFVIWGGLHGGMLALHRVATGRRGEAHGSESPAAWPKILGTFNLVCLAWIFFRCASFDQAIQMISRISGVATEVQSLLPALILSPCLLAIYWVASWLRQRLENWVAIGATQELAYGFGLGGVAAALVLFAAPGAKFIYFEF